MLAEVFLPPLPPRPPISQAMFHIELTFLVRLPSILSLLSLPHSAANRQDFGASGGNEPGGLRRGNRAEYGVGVHDDVSCRLAGLMRDEKFSGFTCVRKDPNPFAPEYSVPCWLSWGCEDMPGVNGAYIAPTTACLLR